MRQIAHPPQLDRFVVCCDETVRVSSSWKPLNLVDLLRDFNRLEVVKFSLVALKLMKKVVPVDSNKQSKGGWVVR
jgi:hypothetical protein